MNQILVVRHAQPASAGEKWSGHWADPELSETGRRQAAQAGDRVKTLLNGSPCRIVSSDLRRAAQTAQAIGRALGQEIELRPELREYKDGLGPGMTTRELLEYMPEPTPPIRDLLANPQRETDREFHGRLVRCMEELLRDESRTPVVVAHYGANNAIVKWWLQIETEAWLETAMASVTVLRIKPSGKRALERLSDTAHL